MHYIKISVIMRAKNVYEGIAQVQNLVTVKGSKQ